MCSKLFSFKIRTIILFSNSLKLQIYNSQRIFIFTFILKEKLSSADFLQKPSQDAFFVQADSTSEEYVLARKCADVNLMKAVLSKDDASLTFYYTTPDYMNKETREKLEPYLRKDPVVLQWQDGKFR